MSALSLLLGLFSRAPKKSKDDLWDRAERMHQKLLEDSEEMERKRNVPAFKRMVQGKEIGLYKPRVAPTVSDKISVRTDMRAKSASSRSSGPVGYNSSAVHHTSYDPNIHLLQTQMYSGAFESNHNHSSSCDSSSSSSYDSGSSSGGDCGGGGGGGD